MSSYSTDRVVEQAIHIHPYYVAVNLVEVARVFVAEWDHVLESTYGRTMQQNWSLYRADPSRFTVAWQDNIMELGAMRLVGLVRDLHATPVHAIKDDDVEEKA